MDAFPRYGTHFLAGDRLLARDAAGQWGAARVMAIGERDGVHSLKVHSSQLTLTLSLSPSLSLTLSLSLSLI